ncbi:MAG: exodeoxyribonuclease V subunit alpha, partial [Waddliaceae bacterium]
DKEQLNVQQAFAIQNALTKSFTVICGGPGTGKTYTAGHLIKLFWESLDEEQKKGCEICLAAPTGKAAANLQKSLQRATAELEGFKPLKAKTLHSLLEIRSSSFSIDRPPTQLKADLILVDESSMIDVRIMALLLASVKTGTRLILLGDRFQLPPVEAGSLFSDVITFLKGDERFSENVSELKTCLRVELQAMIDFATAINHGDGSKAIELLNEENNTSAIERIRFDVEGGNQRCIQDRLIEYAVTLFPSPKVGKNEPGYLLHLYNQFRLLSPLRDGFFGVNEINQKLLLRMMQRVQREEWFAVPIMIVNNDYKMDLFNGEVGILVRRRSYDSYVKEGDYAFFPMDQGESFRKIPAILLPKYEYAYCLSVHKSQGSEFDRVLLLLPQGSEVFGREVLYTAVTRARKKLEVWGAEEVLIQTLVKSSARVSGLTCG